MADELRRPAMDRRTVLKGLGLAAATAGAAGTLGLWPSTAGAAPGTDDDWSDFEAAAGRAFEHMGMVGAAVAVVSADRVLHTSTYGVRDPATGDPVTPGTHFMVASTTKSMSSLLAATYVDEGVLGWDQLVVDVWSGFRAANDELTRTLRVRDLFGMATGMAEGPSDGFHQGWPTVGDLLKSVVNLDVIAPPGQVFSYNNTVYAVGGYLPLLAQGVAVDDLEVAYVEQMAQRVYGPAGMVGARLADDPRPFVAEPARGNGVVLTGGRGVLPYPPVGAFAPVGGTVATIGDMAAYVRLQLRQGVSVTGARVVSATNLEACWKGHVAVSTSAELDPDAEHAAYAMGWIEVHYRGGARLVWHNGGIDGFTTYIGFLPGQDLGLVVLNAMNPAEVGGFFYTYLLDLLLSRQLGLNDGAAAAVQSTYDGVQGQLDELGATTSPVDPAAVAPFLGYYQRGYQVVLEDGELLVHSGPRVLRLLALPDGTYVVAEGLVVGLVIELRVTADGIPEMELKGAETVRWTTGL